MPQQSVTSPEKSDTPLQYVKGIGPRRAEAFATGGIHSLKDLLHLVPRRYLDQRNTVALRDLGSHLDDEDPVLLIGDVVRVNKAPRRFSVIISDDTGTVTLVWFGGIRYWVEAIKEGDRVAAFGRLSEFNGKFQIIHPEIDYLDEETDARSYSEGRILPHYPSWAALKEMKISSKVMRSIMRNALEKYSPDQVKDYFPIEFCRNHLLLPLGHALRAIHFPTSFEELAAARRRIKFQELFFQQLLVALSRTMGSSHGRAPAITPGDLVYKLHTSLPFTLTGSQQQALRDIESDMKKDLPMNRLLQGDVGSGKTIVALTAMLAAVEHGYQCAFMAPTEILQEQHYQTLSKLLTPFGINVVQLVGGQKKKLRAALLEDIASGKAQIIVGTHALIESTVAFNKLGLVVIDEQHRFGVMQRAALRKHTSDGIVPHTLVMSATPIPRSLALTLYGDLDVSVMNEMPAGRKPISTHLLFESEHAKLFDAIRRTVGRGEQVFIVYPLVEKSEKMALKSATEEHVHLQKNIFPELKIGLLHGQMFWYEKEETMKAFRDGQFQVLIATTVIEVGIDIPNATVMVIEHADRFGLAQLHQLRGRVGRGAKESHCVLVAPDELKVRTNITADERLERRHAIERLQTMVRTIDGFEIAEVDLKLRGGGDFFGTKQSGLPEFLLANPVFDIEIVKEARVAAKEIVKYDPHLRAPEHEQLRNEFFKTYCEALTLAGIG